MKQFTLSDFIKELKILEAEGLGEYVLDYIDSIVSTQNRPDKVMWIENVANRSDRGVTFNLRLKAPDVSPNK